MMGRRAVLLGGVATAGSGVLPDATSYAATGLDRRDRYVVRS